MAEKKVECSICNKKFQYNSRLKDHYESVHNNIKRFECAECDKTFYYKYKLKRHNDYVHNDIRRFECAECDMTFHDNNKLKNHTDSVHKNIRNFKCNKCDKLFVSKGNSGLGRHMLIHDNELKESLKNTKCNTCDFKCLTKAELHSHMWSRHSISLSEKFKKHQCNICESSFKLYPNLQEHLWFIHDISSSEVYKNYQCNLCTHIFKSNGNLQKHHLRCTGLRNISSIEFQCIKALSELGINEEEDYIFNKAYYKLTDWSGKSLRPDILFIEHKTMIELDGQQHFEPRTFGSISQEQAEANFKITQENDKIKDNFCKEFGYRMIRIPYTETDNMLSILHVELQDILDF
jgi:uncharacterized Zn-finger protein